MAVNLTKGGRISLNKEAPGLKKILIGLGWDTNASDTGADFDLDASVFLLDSNAKVANEKDFVFYNNLSSSDGSVVHTGDNRTGEGDGDDESIKVDLSKISSSIKEIAIVVTIHEAAQRKQNFGMVRNAFIRLVNDETNTEIVRYDLEEDYSTETGLLFGRLYFKDNEWKFSAVGTGYKEGLDGFCKQFGLNS
ncbi:MAG: TerD family protein [Campylobacter sp.]|uniref:TerD family protein n=1 Tax=Campylobacter TaxID=194 RepID=UPI000A34AEDF|nr:MULTISPECIES: TerD family protein [unclassified Campylobacter]MDD6925089.1 TerD family protein [Campylobacteraceae bacterium]MCI6339288.1 TerD family protein [Campylobacter sp.]MDY3668410.1 TerD family protein [Campylobacter sp.]MDY3671680.1 TerD family protein [Campylobacter sp.]MDY4153893.1 TerD family protein [Campylobacter sp.]